MKRILSLLIAALIILASASMLFACDTSDDGGKDKENGASDGTSGGEDSEGDSSDDELAEYSVRLGSTVGILITSPNPVTVKEGESAEFDVQILEGYAFSSVTAGGEYNAATGKLVIPNVTDNLRVTLSTVKVNLNLEKYVYKFHALSTDSSTSPDGPVAVGTTVTVNATATSREFLGWSFTSPTDNVAAMVSTERSYSFVFDATHLGAGETVEIYANYADRTEIRYDANGGVVNMASANLSSSKYYTVTEENTGVLLKYSAAYYDKVGAASLFYDDGSFVRPGYVLKEFNTKADGSGVGYSLGSKFSMNSAENTLYCIWAEDSAHTDFEYYPINIAKPSGVLDAPHWQESGIIITAYNGSAGEIVSPEKINGNPVIAIAAGAFENKAVTSLVLPRTLLMVEDGAFVGCSSLTTIYYPDSIYYIGNAAFDSSSWAGVKSFYVNATMAPRYANTLEGAFSIKLSRLLTSEGKSRVVVVAGSSTLQGLSSDYLEALLDGSYEVINFGTTRTTHGTMILEAMGELASSMDIVLYAPENSIYMLGEPSLYWKTLRDLESMYNVFRHIDISKYENVIGAFAELNAGSGNNGSADPLAYGRYTRAATRYEDIINVTSLSQSLDYVHQGCASYVNESNYTDYYTLTLNNMARSTLEGLYNPNNQTAEEDKWCDMTESKYVTLMNHAIDAAKSSGAKVYFAFAPIDADKLSDEAKANVSAQTYNYDWLIINTYNFDDILGSSKNYIYNHRYFYNNAYHTNYYGKVWRTYGMYTDLASLLNLGSVKNYDAVGTNFDGCLFESVGDNSPLYKAYDN